MSYEDKLKLAQAMVVPRKNCRKYDYQTGESMQEHIHDENCSHDVVVKGRAEGATTMTPDQMQQMLANLFTGTRHGARIDPPLLTSEQILEKRKLQCQENAKQRRIRKSIKNKALAVATSKYDRRRIERGATAQELQAVPAEVTDSSKRARTLRREEARKMAKLSRKFSTKQAEPAQAS